MNIKIIYETQNGNTQYACEVMQRELMAAGNTVALHSIRYQGVTPDLNGVDLVIFGAPTYDDGLLESTMRTFIEQFTYDFSHLKVAVFGMGNRTYPQFCKAADLLADWVTQNNGKLIIEPLRVDSFPDNLVPLMDWVQQLLVATR